MRENLFAESFSLKIILRRNMKEFLMSPRVSIIMGVYNCECTLSRAIESILNQNYSDWELIMCDDASTDHTVGIAKEYEERYPQKITLLQNRKNMKLAYSLNQCLKVAQGEYIARMDADDISLPDRLRVQVDFLDEHPEYQVVSCRYTVFDESGDYNTVGVEGEPQKDCMLKDVPFAHPTIMMRKCSYDALGGYTVLPRTERGQDMDMWFRFFAMGFRGYLMKDILYKYYDSKTVLHNKQSIKKAFYYFQTRLYGIRLLGYSPVYYIYALRPFASILIPWRIKMLIRKE